MQGTPGRLRTIATAMIILGLLVETVGAGLLVMNRTTSAATVTLRFER